MKEQGVIFQNKGRVKIYRGIGGAYFFGKIRGGRLFFEKKMRGSKTFFRKKLGGEDFFTTKFENPRFRFSK